jgi:hypothetical protein
MHVPRSWTEKHWCLSVVDTQWPFAYSKYHGQAFETQGRAISSEQDVRHVCSRYGTESKCHICEDIACGNAGGETLFFCSFFLLLFFCSALFCCPVVLLFCFVLLCSFLLLYSFVLLFLCSALFFSSFLFFCSFVLFVFFFCSFAPLFFCSLFCV